MRDTLIPTPLFAWSDGDERDTESAGSTSTPIVTAHHPSALAGAHHHHSEDGSGGDSSSSSNSAVVTQVSSPGAVTSGVVGGGGGGGEMRVRATRSSGGGGALIFDPEAADATASPTAGATLSPSLSAHYTMPSPTHAMAYGVVPGAADRRASASRYTPAAVLAMERAAAGGWPMAAHGHGGALGKNRMSLNGASSDAIMGGSSLARTALKLPASSDSMSALPITALARFYVPRGSEDSDGGESDRSSSSSRTADALRRGGTMTLADWAAARQAAVAGGGGTRPRYLTDEDASLMIAPAHCGVFSASSATSMGSPLADLGAAIPGAVIRSNAAAAAAAAAAVAAAAATVAADAAAITHGVSIHASAATLAGSPTSLPGASQRSGTVPLSTVQLPPIRGAM